MSDRVIVLTGASDGIGAAAAKAFTDAGEQVVVVGRSASKTASVAERIGARAFVCDFAELAQVRLLAAQLLEHYPRIDVLANNAGGIFGAERRLTADGHEQTFQVNYLAPFLLTTLLIDRLLESDATVVNTSSVANRLFGKLDLAGLDDLDGERSYSPTRAYGDAKLAQILFTRELARRYGAQGLSAAAFHPGVISTNFSNSPDGAMRLLYATPFGRRLLNTPEEGADTLFWLAESQPGIDWTSGGYFAKRKPARMNRRATDTALAAALWDRTEAMLAPVAD
ncbi:SDR family NAD(P)-dependent oxidoreductase [Plantibacter flavus]|uniref:SDR family NAD(P)-dependent oxidoreductase n=1 Tax=Plantibacter flavus TaxID=150123 RepID=UPI003F14F8CC